MTPYYQDSAVTIYHGDARLLVDVCEPLIDLFVTDPPYGIEHSSSQGASWSGSQIANDQDTSVRDAVLNCMPNRSGFCFGSWKMPRPLRTRAVLIWDKGPAFGMGDLAFPWKNSFEEIYVIGTGFVGSRDEGVLKGYLTVSWESKGRCHPNEKPVPLLRYLISKAPSARTIFDPFMGSGTALRAAKDLGLQAIGIEIEERYCEIAARRMSQEVLDFGNEVESDVELTA